LNGVGADGEATVYLLDLCKPVPLGRGNLLLGLSAHWQSEDSLVLQESFTMGELTRLSGYNLDEFFGRHVGLANAIYYRKLHTGEGRPPIYFGGSLEIGAPGWRATTSVLIR
jgi:hypothetical protein